MASNKFATFVDKPHGMGMCSSGLPSFKVLEELVPWMKYLFPDALKKEDRDDDFHDDTDHDSTSSEEEDDEEAGDRD